MKFFYILRKMKNKDEENDKNDFCRRIFQHFFLILLHQLNFFQRDNFLSTYF